MIDWNIRFGDLLVVASMGAAGIVYAFRSGRFAETVVTMQKEIKELKDLAKSLTGVVTTQAIQTHRLDTQAERLNILDKRIDDLRRGHGFIRGHKGIDGEYDG